MNYNQKLKIMKQKSENYLARKFVDCISHPLLPFAVVGGTMIAVNGATAAREYSDGLVYSALYGETLLERESANFLMGVESLESNVLGFIYGSGITAALKYIADKVAYRSKLQK